MNIKNMKSLGLPNPYDLKNIDLEFLRAYSIFFRSIDNHLLGDSIAVCNSEQFIHPGPAAIQILCALLRPTKDDVAKMRSVLREVRGIFKSEGSEKDPDVYRTIKEFEDFRTTELYKKFTMGQKRTKELINFRFIGSGSPSYTWDGEIDVRRINDEWAIVLHRYLYRNGEMMDWNVFPLVLGFVKIEGLYNNVGLLLINNRLAHDSNWNTIVGDQKNDENIEKLVYCFSKFGKDTPYFGYFVLSLKEEELAEIRRNFKKNGLKDFVLALQDVFKRYPNVDKYNIFILMEKYRPITAETIKRLEMDLHRDQEVKNYGKIRKDKINKERRQRLLNALPLLSPEGFPKEMLVSDLSEEDYLQLNRWIEREKGIRDLRVEKKVQYPRALTMYNPDYDFCAVFQRGEKEERMFFDKRKSLVDAFKEIFASYQFDMKKL